MNAAILSNFGSLVSPPGAAPRLRGFILDLAARGRLVEQRADEEPASDLRARIIAEATLAASGRRRRSAQSSESRPNPPPLQVPKSWEWVRLTDLADVSYGFAFPSALFNERRVGSPLIRIRDIASVDTEAYYQGEFDPSYVVRAGDYLVGMDGDFNLRRWQGPEGLLNQRVMRIKGWRSEIASDFLVIPLQMILNQLHEQTSLSTVKHLSAKQVNSIFLPLPPLTEQHRIVAKVDELMSLCDELELAQAEREDLRSEVVISSLARLTKASDGGDEVAFRESASFYLNHLPQVTALPKHVAALRGAILRLGIQGRLVEQCGSDELVADFLERVTAHRRTVGRKGERGRVPGFRPEEINPFDIPSTWVWATLGELTVCRDGKRVPVSKEERRGRYGPYDYYGASGPIDKIDGYLFDQPLLLVGEDGANLLNRSTPIAFIVRGKYWVNNHAHVLEAVDEDFLRYLDLHINAIDLKPYVTGTAQPKMNQARMNSIPIAVPPAREQRRIIQRVDELLSMCAELQESLAHQTSAKLLLLDAVLNKVLTMGAH